MLFVFLRARGKIVCRYGTNLSPYLGGFFILKPCFFRSEQGVLCEIVNNLLILLALKTLYLLRSHA